MQSMAIVVQRERKAGDLVTGTLLVNGQVVGKTYENANAKLMIPAGRYPGYLRYVSQRNFVQGPLGSIGHAGDFLVEVGNVPGRTNILLHGGNKPQQSKGCIMLGGVGKDPKTGLPHLEYDHPLRKLRRLFYGSETPVMTPAKNVTIQVNDLNACYR